MILPTIDINYGNEAGLEGIDLDALSAKAIEATITNAGLVVPKDAELSLLICDDNLIQELNGQWRGKHNPTNVLSFSGDNNPYLNQVLKTRHRSVPEGGLSSDDQASLSVSRRTY